MDDRKLFITSQAEIPKADFYVCCTDKFMSGWGPSQGKPNRIILSCTRDEVDYVEAYARSRPEMIYVTVCLNKPKLNGHTTYSLKSRDKARAWYPEGE